MTRARRVWRSLVAPIVAGTLVLSACGGGVSAGGGIKGFEQLAKGGNDINAVDPNTLRDGGTLTLGVDQIPDNYNVNQIDGNVLDGVRALNAMMPSLFSAKQDGSVEINQDYLQSAEVTAKDPQQVVTYQVNPKARWTDGTPITWEDFAAQWQALNGTNRAYQVNGTTGYEDIGSVEKGANDREVKVTFKKRFAEWQSLYSPLYPKSVNASPEAFNTSWAGKPAGATAGPFKFGDVDTTAKILTLVRDPHWWGSQPRLDKLVFRVTARSALADALANDAIDWYPIGSSAELFARAERMAGQGVAVRQALASDFSHLTFNGAPGAILSDQKVRVAIQKGIDAQSIARAAIGPILPDVKQMGNHLFVEGTKNYEDHANLVPFDPAQAKRELDAAGWKMAGDFRKKDGAELHLRFVQSSPNPVSQQIALLTQAQLKGIGVNVEIQAVPQSDYFKQYVNAGNFDIAGYRLIGSVFPISATKPNYGLYDTQQSNPGRIGNKTINDRYDQANSELDDAARVRLGQDIDKEIWKAGTQLLLYQVPDTVAVRAKLANFGAFGFASWDYTKIGYMK